MVCTLESWGIVSVLLTGTTYEVVGSSGFDIPSAWPP